MEWHCGYNNVWWSTPMDLITNWSNLKTNWTLIVSFWHPRLFPPELFTSKLNVWWSVQHTNPSYFIFCSHSCMPSRYLQLKWRFINWILYKLWNLLHVSKRKSNRKYFRGKVMHNFMLYFVCSIHFQCTINDNEDIFGLNVQVTKCLGVLVG